MTFADVIFLTEEPAHDAEIERINAEAFGPGRFARAAYRIREGGPHERALSFVAMLKDDVVGSVRMTRVAAGHGRALMLGPLAVRPQYKKLGIGKQLVGLATDAAMRAHWPAVILVGDESYYGPLGFARIARGQVSMPRPVDLGRVLALEFSSGAISDLSGMIDHEDRQRLQER